MEEVPICKHALLHIALLQGRQKHKDITEVSAAKAAVGGMAAQASEVRGTVLNRLAARCSVWQSALVGIVY